jgi:diguanylate cyclase
LERLAALTRELVEAARVTDEELGRARDEMGALRASLEDARQAAARDHLTGLPNRRGFEEAAARRGSGRNGWLALCDLDRFKEVNDEHGHDAGDRVLRFFAQKLAAAVGDRALVARHGGEEFVCLFAEDEVAPVAAVLDDLRRDLEARSLVNRDTGRRIGPITFSGGLARVDGDPDAALRRADAALYRAKHAGRNRLVVADD